MNRREFVQALAIAAAAGLRLTDAHADTVAYDLPRFGNVHLLHFTDCHAQLLPIEYREPNMEPGRGASGPGSRRIWLDTRCSSATASHPARALHTRSHRSISPKQHAAMAAWAASRIWPRSSSACAPRARMHCCSTAAIRGRARPRRCGPMGRDMVDAALALGVDVMTPHWEMTYGADRVRHVVDHDFKNKVAFVAQNIQTADFGDPVFDPYVLRELNGVPVAIIGQAFPYTPRRAPGGLHARLDFRHSGRTAAEDDRRGARQGRQGGRAAVAQRHGCGPEAGLARARLDAILVGTRTMQCRRRSRSATRAA